MVIIMDDDKESAEHIKMLLCMECGFREAAVNIFNKPVPKLLEVIKNDKNRTINTVILDVSLKADYDGIVVAEKIVNIREDMHIIFVTSYGKFYIQQALLFSYKVIPVAYLLKPVNKYFLKRAVEKIRYIERSHSSIWIKTQRSTIGVKANDIIYIGIDGHCTAFYTKDDVYKSYISIEEIAGTLPSIFLRCHKSFIINSEYISEYNTSTEVNLKNGMVIPISRTYRSFVKKYIEQLPIK